MKTLNEKATKIMLALMALKRTKINNSQGVYMPVHFEVVWTDAQNRYISLAHYGIQNGDAMRDPEMMFINDMEKNTFAPYHYRNDYMGLETNSIVIEDGKIIVQDEWVQADQTEFANQWLLNIAEQQGITI